MILKPSRRPSYRMLLVGTAVLALLAASATFALARDNGSAADRNRASADAAAAGIAGQTTGGVCKVGYDTESSTLTPPDDSTSDNVPAGSIRIKKTCPGAVVGMLTSEVSMPTTADFIHIDMRATCVAAAHLQDPCTVGQQVLASPGHTFFQNGQVPIHTGAIQMVWSGLARGSWRFEVLPGGNNSGNLQFRTFVVTAYNGG